MTMGRHEPTHTTLFHPTGTKSGLPTDAVLVGCEAAAWWLRQRWGHVPVLAALVIGGLAAAVSFVGGPLGAAGVAIAGSAVSLMTLARASRIGTITDPPADTP